MRSLPLAVVCVVIAALSGLAAAGPASGQALIAEFGDETAGRGDLGGNVSDVTIDDDGNVWVSDPSNNRLVKFDYNGTFIAEFGAPTIVDPGGLDATRDGIYVVDGSSVKLLDTGGRLLRTFDGGGAERSLLNPIDVAVERDTGIVHVTDSNRSAIMRFRPNGTALAPLAGTGSGPDSLSSPASIDVAPGGPIYVANSGTGTIRRYSLDGALQKTFDMSGFTGSIAGVTVEPTGDVLGVDFGGSTIWRFDRDGVTKGSFASSGLGAGQLAAPGGIVADCRGNVYVVDSRNERRPDGSFESFTTQGKVVKFGDPATPPPPCTARSAPTSGFVAQALDVDVTQGIQTERTGPPAPGLTAVYGSGGRTDVGLAERRRTVVRFYASLASGPAGGLGNIPATLTGTKTVGGRRIDLGSISAGSSPAVLRPGVAEVDHTMRVDPAGAYTFTLPYHWTEGTVDLVANVNPAGLGCADEACRALGRFTLNGIPFRKTGSLDVVPVALTINGHRPPDDPATAFEQARILSPIPIGVRPYRGTLDISDIVAASSAIVPDCFLDINFDPFCSDEEVALDRTMREAMVTQRIADWFDDVNDSTAILPYGLIDRNGPGGQVGGTQFGDIGDVIGVQRGDIDDDDQAIAHGDVVRPRTIIAHELFHAVGLDHAGTDSNCYTDPKDVGEAWPPDEQGLTQGIGMDVAPDSGGGRGPYRILAPGLANGPAQWFDLMSYCANSAESPMSGSDAWISTRNWDRLLAVRAPLGRLAARTAAPRQAAGANTVELRGIVLADGRMTITDVGPVAPGAPGPAGPPAADGLVLEARSADGTVLATAPMRARVLEVDRGATVTLVTGQVSAAGAESVNVSRGPAPIALRKRSANAPKVRVLAPARGGRPRGAAVTVRWAATDADAGGAPLRAAVDYSADDGRTWKTVTTHVTGTSAVLRAGLLPASRRARVRIRVNDGFNETAVTSARFTAPGAPPLVRIIDPVDGRPIAADAGLLLAGEALDDAGRALSGRALTWRLGRRVLGRGAAITATDLPAGRRTIVLEARDAQGRRARRSVTVDVQAVPPLFLRLAGPARVGARARTVSLSVATNVGATLKAGATTAKVGRKARTVRVRIQPGSGPLALVVTLRAGGRTTRETLTIPRG